MNNCPTYEEAMNIINEYETTWKQKSISEEELMALFGERLNFIKDIEEEMYHAYGIYYLKLKKGILLFPRDGNGTIKIDKISKVTEEWIEPLAETLKVYKIKKEEYERAIIGLEEILESQKLRMIFKK